MKSYSFSSINSSDAVTQIHARLESLLEGCEDMPDAHTLVELSRGVAQYLEDTGLPLDTAGKGMMQAAGHALGAIGKKSLGDRIMFASSGLASDSCWSTSGDESLWVINFESLCGDGEVVMEIELFRRLGLLLDRLASLWTEGGCPQAIGMRRVKAASAAMLGVSKQSSRVDRLCIEIRKEIACRLKKIADENQWDQPPKLISFDVV